MGPRGKTTIVFRGRTWIDNIETLTTTVDGRYHPHVWEFGETLWQVVVDVDYANPRAGMCDGAWRSQHVRVGFPPRRTMHEAMAAGVAHAKRLAWATPPGAEATVAAMRRRSPDIFPTRWRALDQLFCVIGNGYAWLDGAIVDVTRETFLPDERRRWQQKRRELKAAMERTDQIIARLAAFKPFEPPAPKPAFSFYPASERYSAITTVPDDVRPDWLALARETALAMIAVDVDNTADAMTALANVALARQALVEFDTRFGPAQC